MLKKTSLTIAQFSVLHKCKCVKYVFMEVVKQKIP